MNFVSFYEGETHLYISQSYSARNLKSSFVCDKIFISSGRISIYGELFNPIQNIDKFKIFGITSKYFLLYSESLNHNYIMYIGKGAPVFIKVESTPTYIFENSYLAIERKRKTGFIVKKFTFIDDEIFMDKKILPLKFFYILDRYFLYKYCKGKYTVFAEETFFMKEFFVDINWIFVDKPLFTKKSECEILVNFKDRQKFISSTKLQSLESSFIEEQLLSSDVIYLDINFCEYENMTIDFLIYVNSYIINKKIKFIVEERLSQQLHSEIKFDKTEVKTYRYVITPVI